MILSVFPWCYSGSVSVVDRKYFSLTCQGNFALPLIKDIPR
jgi:hypothetical protein